MTKEQQALLLATARLLREQIRRGGYAEAEEDLWVINEALEPFEAERMQKAPGGKKG